MNSDKKNKILLAISIITVLISIGLIKFLNLNPYAVFLITSILLGLLLTQALSLP